MNKSERERQILCDITYMWNLRYDTNELIHESERLTDMENRFVTAYGGGGWVGLGFWE